jgi:hypothetical protein
MIIISDLSYVEVISASSIIGGANEVSGTSTTTTSTDKSSVKKEAKVYLKATPKPVKPVKSDMALVDDLLSQAEKALLDE